MSDINDLVQMSIFEDGYDDPKYIATVAAKKAKSDAIKRQVYRANSPTTVPGQHDPNHWTDFGPGAKYTEPKAKVTTSPSPDEHKYPIPKPPSSNPINHSVSAAVSPHNNTSAVASKATKVVNHVSDAGKGIGDHASTVASTATKAVNHVSDAGKGIGDHASTVASTATKAANHVSDAGKGIVGHTLDVISNHPHAAIGAAAIGGAAYLKKKFSRRT